MKSHWLLIILLGLTSVAGAKEPNTANTYRLGGATSPSATLDAAAMLVGSWSGEAFGARFEETWNPPSANTMVGMFKVFDDHNGVSFYELMIIEQVDASLVLKVKHFSADFSAWEARDEYVSMPLVDLQENELHFAGLSFYRRSDKLIDAYIAIKGAEGTKEEQLVYRRVE